MKHTKYKIKNYRNSIYWDFPEKFYYVMEFPTRGVLTRALFLFIVEKHIR